MRTDQAARHLAQEEYPTVIVRPVSSLKPHPQNARTHSKHQIRQIAASIREFGFTNPVLIDSSNTIIAGHGRVLAATLLGIKTVPAICLQSMTPDQVRAYILADNRLAEKAGWDRGILAVELQHLLTIDNFDVTLTGFEGSEIDLILEEASSATDRDDVFSVDDEQLRVTQIGDVWHLGKHRIACGSALHIKAFRHLMGGKQADVVFTDPPYNVAIDGNVSGKGAHRHREFAMASGEMSEAEFVAFLTTSLKLLHQFSRPESVHFICMDWRHMGELLSAGRQVYVELLNICVWVKNNGGMGSFYRSQHELIFVFRNGAGKHCNNIQLGRFGRNRTNVWEYPCINTLSKSSEEGNLAALHPTVKPVRMIADALLDCTARGNLVLDCFLGSGSTLIAAERTGRICYGIEIDPLYVDVAVRRWQRYTGERAVNSATGKPFDESVREEVRQ